VATGGVLRNRYYKLSNISEQKVTVKIVTQDGTQIEDYLEIGEVVYGLNDNAVSQLKFYQLLGLIKIEETEHCEDPKVRWLVEGF
jgi:hypothetical protein